MRTATGSGTAQAGTWFAQPECRSLVQAAGWEACCLLWTPSDHSCMAHQWMLDAHDLLTLLCF